MDLMPYAERAVRDTAYRAAIAEERRAHMPPVTGTSYALEPVAGGYADTPRSTAVMPAVQPVQDEAYWMAHPDEMLDTIQDRWLTRYVAYPDQRAADIVSLWKARNHMRYDNGDLIGRVSPRLYLMSSEPASGKSTVLEELNLACPYTFGLDIEPTQYGLIYSIAQENATILLDEGDILFGAGQRKSAVRAIVNAGYTENGSVTTGRGSKATRVPVFGAMAVAALDTMQTRTGDLLAAMLSRGIKITMKPAKPALRWSATAEKDGVIARNMLQWWAMEVRDGIRDAEPDIPPWLDGRPAQLWAELFKVAELAGGTWPERARLASKPGRDFPAEFAQLGDEDAATLGPAFPSRFAGLDAAQQELIAQAFRP